MERCMQLRRGPVVVTTHYSCEPTPRFGGRRNRNS